MSEVDFPASGEPPQTAAQAGAVVASQAQPCLIAQPWISTFIAVLTQPRVAFRQILINNAQEWRGLPQAVATVLLVFALDGIRMANPNHLASAWMTVPLSVALGTALWLALSSVVTISASCFGAGAPLLRAGVVSLGWSFAPWIFMTPIFCYRPVVGTPFVLLAAVPYLWVFLLQMLALSEIYKLRSWQTVALFFAVPMLLGLAQTLQFVASLYISLAALT